MSGNVWEWTRSLWADADGNEFGYPYAPGGAREALDAPASVLRVLRGGAFNGDEWFVRCACRGWPNPNGFGDSIGFRVLVVPFEL